MILFEAKFTLIYSAIEQTIDITNESRFIIKMYFSLRIVFSYFGQKH